MRKPKMERWMKILEKIFRIVCLLVILLGFFYFCETMKNINASQIRIEKTIKNTSDSLIAFKKIYIIRK